MHSSIAFESRARSHDGEGAAAAAGVSVVKVFSATKSRERSALGERVTTWLSEHPGLVVTRATVALSSDSQFHCLSIVLMCADVAGAPRSGG